MCSINWCHSKWLQIWLRSQSSHKYLMQFGCSRLTFKHIIFFQLWRGNISTDFSIHHFLTQVYYPSWLHLSTVFKKVCETSHTDCHCIITWMTVWQSAKCRLLCAAVLCEFVVLVLMTSNSLHFSMTTSQQSDRQWCVEKSMKMIRRKNVFDFKDLTDTAVNDFECYFSFFCILCSWEHLT